MSIIVAVQKGRRLAMAGDTLTSFGSHRDSTDNVTCMKIQRVGGALLGCTGWSLYANILDHFIKPSAPPVLKDERSVYNFFLKLWKALRERYALVNEQCAEKNSPFGDLDASFLVACRGGIFGISSDMSVTRYRKYHAIGCGQDYAYGALLNIYDLHSDAREIAAQAVRTAIHFDIHCGGEVQISVL